MGSILERDKFRNEKITDDRLKCRETCIIEYGLAARNGLFFTKMNCNSKQIYKVDKFRTIGMKDSQKYFPHISNTSIAGLAVILGGYLVGSILERDKFRNEKITDDRLKCRETCII